MISHTAGNTTIMYQSIELPPIEERRESLKRLRSALKEFSSALADARTEFVFMSEEERAAWATSIMDALLK